MKKYIYLIVTALCLFTVISCKKYPVDDNGLLITSTTTCSMASFQLLGADNQSVLVAIPTSTSGIDTTKLTVTAIAKFGTNLAKVKPYCTLTAGDTLVEPFMGVWTDFTVPRTYTLVSGNRQIRKTYTITITVQK